MTEYYLHGQGDAEYTISGIRIPKGRYTEKERARGRGNVVGISAAQYEQLQRSPLFLRLCNEGKVSVDHEEASGEAGRQDSAAAGAYDLEKARLIKAVAEQDAELAALRATVSRQSEELDELRQRLRRKQQRGNESLGDAAALAQPDE